MDVRTGFFVLIVIGFGAVSLLMIAPFVPYLAGAALLAFLLYPLQVRLEPRAGPRITAISLVLFALVAAIIPLFILSAIVIDSVRSLAQQADEVNAIILEFEQAISALLGVEFDVLGELRRYIARLVESVLAELTGFVSLTVHISVGLLLLIFVLYYLLVDGERLIEWLKLVTPLEASVQDELIDEIDRVTRAVLRSHVFVAIVEGLLGGIALYLVGVPNAAFWTVVMMIVSVMPIIGVWLVWAPAVAYLFAIGDTAGALMLLAYGSIVLGFVDNYLRAIFVDMEAGLHPAVVLVGVVGGIYLFGVIGLFLGPILLAVFKACVNVFGRTHGTSPPERPRDTT